MTLPLELSKDIVLQELSLADGLIKSNGWVVEHPKDGIFIVKMVNPIDQQLYLLECNYENYNQWPIYYEFIDPETGEQGNNHAYPKDRGFPPGGGIFHDQPCICLESSRKAYGSSGGPHPDWELEKWKDLCRQSGKGSLVQLGDTLQKIWIHISNPISYVGRMA